MAARCRLQVKGLMKQHNLVPAAFRFGVKLTDEGDQATFEAGLAQFQEEAPLCAAAGFTRTAMHILPWSLTEALPFGEHFRMAVERLKLVAPILREHDIHLGVPTAAAGRLLSCCGPGLEFLGSFGNRRTAAHDFIHTIEGVRCLAAAAGIESHVGLKVSCRIVRAGILMVMVAVGHSPLVGDGRAA